MKVLHQASIQNKKKLQQAFLSLIVLNLSHQCILPGNNAKSSYDHLIKTQYTKDFQFSIASIPTKKIFVLKSKMHKKPDYLLFSNVFLTSPAKYLTI